MTEDLPTIPGYTLKHLLGEGGMARVYLAIQRGFERPVALKIIARELAASEEFGKRFLREARIVGMLSHQHIVPVYDVGEHDRVFYLAMEILADGDLRSRMDKPMAESVALDIMRQLASALGYAHKKGFIHRDVKPDNVLFRDAHTAVLTDFGIARAAEDSEDMTQITQVQSVIGSPKYMSPEQSLGHKLDARTDIYSLGIMLFHMLTGAPPYSGRNLTEISLQRFEQQQPVLPAHLQHLQPLMDRMAAYDRDQRFANCDELLAALIAAPASPAAITSDTVADATAILAAPEAAPGVSGERQQGTHVSSRRAAMFGGTALLVLLAAGGWFALREQEQAVADINPASPAETPLAAAGNDAAAAGIATPALDDGSAAEPASIEAGAGDTEYSGHAAPTSPGVDGHSTKVGDRAVAMGGPGTSMEPAAETNRLESTAVPVPGTREFFAFYDAVNQGVPGAEEVFVAAYPNSIFADILRVKMADDNAVVAILRQQASADSARAQLVLSELYDTGWAGTKDKQAALRYATDAAQSGAPLALYNRAILLLSVAETDAEQRAALRVLERAAQQRFFLAQTVLANYLFEGQVLARDVEESLRLFEQAGEQGDRNALFNLGRIYDAGLHLDAPDTARARRYFLAAAKLGHPQAQDYLKEPL